MATNQSQQNLIPFEQSIVAAQPQFLQLAKAAKRGIDYHREVNFALSIIRESEYLQKCVPESFQEAFENLGAMGLSLNKNLGQAALIPRWNAKRKCNWATVMPMYRGYIALATSGTSIKNVWGAVVVDGDDFKMVRGSHPRIEHIVPLAKKGQKRVPSPENVLGAYVVADIAGSSHPHVTWMDVDDILSVAERSDSYNPKPRKGSDGPYTPKPSGPWITDFGQMCVKTVFRRAQKTWPGIDSADYTALQEAVRVDTAAEIMDHQQTEAVAEDAVLLVSLEQSVQLMNAANAVKCNPATICKSYGVEHLKDLPADKFEEVKQRIKAFGDKRKTKA